MSVARHSWIKLKLHVYICQKCGTGKVNEHAGGGVWQARYHMPDGTSQVLRHVPLCQVGELTARYLKKHEAAIAIGGLLAVAGDDVESDSAEDVPHEREPGEEG